MIMTMIDDNEDNDDDHDDDDYDDDDDHHHNDDDYDDGYNGNSNDTNDDLFVVRGHRKATARVDSDSLSRDSELGNMLITWNILSSPTIPLTKSRPNGSGYTVAQKLSG